MKHLNKMDYSDHKQVTDPDFFLKWFVKSA